MATNTAPEQTLFVRKASGLVKGWSGGDGFRYSFFSVNLFLAIWSFAYATFIPGGSLFWSIVITAIFIVLEIIVYAGLISAMPRAGGDYVWMTRIFNSAIGFVIAACGWWFILWLWTPIYADMGVQTTVKPIFRILGLNGAADWLGSRTGIFVASLVVIAIASTLVAIGMKSYAVFQKWAMWIGIAGVIVCGILLLVTSGANFKEKFNAAADKYYGDNTARSTFRSTRPTTPATSSTTTPAAIVVAEGETVPGRLRDRRGGRLGHRHADLDVHRRPQLGHLDAHPVHAVLDDMAELGGDPLRRGARRQGLPQEHLPDARRPLRADRSSRCPSWA